MTDKAQEITVSKAGLKAICGLAADIMSRDTAIIAATNEAEAIITKAKKACESAITNSRGAYMVALKKVSDVLSKEHKGEKFTAEVFKAHYQEALKSALLDAGVAEKSVPTKVTEIKTALIAMVAGIEPTGNNVKKFGDESKPELAKLGLIPAHKSAGKAKRKAKSGQGKAKAEGPALPRVIAGLFASKVGVDIASEIADMLDIIASDTSAIEELHDWLVDKSAEVNGEDADLATELEAAAA